jgi:hypothetical protein
MKIQIHHDARHVRLSQVEGDGNRSQMHNNPQHKSLETLNFWKLAEENKIKMILSRAIWLSMSHCSVYCIDIVQPLRFATRSSTCSVVL